jgi:hypothetical protein
LLLLYLSFVGSADKIVCLIFVLLAENRKRKRDVSDDNAFKRTTKLGAVV